MRPAANPQGNARKSTAPVKVQPENLLPTPPVPDVPAALDSHGTKIWHAVWAAGGDAYHGPTDAYVIERYCVLHDRHHTLMRMIENDGLTSVGSQGQVVLHPAARLIADTEKQLGGLEDRLGLNPESRLRLGISSVEAQTKLDQFLNKDN